MLWSRLFIPTLRTNPAGEPPSRQLLQRAGYLRGADRWLPLARRSLRRIVGIVREEMDAAGGQEMLLPDGAAFETVAREVRSYKQLPQIWYRFGAEYGGAMVFARAHAVRLPSAGAYSIAAAWPTR